MENYETEISIVMPKMIEQFENQKLINDNLVKIVEELQKNNTKYEKLLNNKKETELFHFSKNILNSFKFGKQYTKEKIEPTLEESNANQLLKENLEEQPKISGFQKIKSIVATHLVDIGQKHIFKEKNNLSFANLLNKVTVVVKSRHDSVPELYINIKNDLILKAKKANVILNGIDESLENSLVHSTKTINYFHDKFFLIGKQKSIQKLKTSFSGVLNLIGFEAEDLIYENKKANYLSAIEVSKNINKELEEQLKLVKSGNQYFIPDLEKADDNVKAEMITKMIWPKVMSKIQDSLGLIMNMEKTRENDNYMKIVAKFSKKSDLTEETVIHALNTTSEFLQRYKGFDVLDKNKRNIKLTLEKYEILSRNNFIVLHSLVKAATNLELMVNSYAITEEAKNNILDKMDNTNLGQTNGKIHTFKFIENQVNQKLSDPIFIQEMVKDITFKNNDVLPKRFKIKA